MNEHLLKLQDRAWTIKETCDDLAARKLTDADAAVVQSVDRDLARLHAKLVALRDKFKGRGRKKSAEPAPNGGQSELPV